MSGGHDKIIATAAKATLQPLGLRRKGKSRLWIGDHGWWIAVVEFQPSSFSKGSYLNVAAHWLWSDTGYVSFDLGSGVDWGCRAAEFEAYESDVQFEGAATRLATVAADRVHALSARILSINATADMLFALEAATLSGSWTTYNAGVAAGLAGRACEADAMLRSVTDARVKSAADRYIELTSDLAAFKAVAVARIANQRAALRLPAASTAPF